MKIFVTQHQNGSVTSCNYPIQETLVETGLKVDSQIFEVTEENYLAVREGSKAVEFTKTGKIRCVDQTAKREAALAEAEEVFKKREIRKRELISKVTKGTATETEQEEFANLL